MFQQIMAIANFVLESFLHIWPYLLVTIPIAVAVRMSGASKYITAALQARPLADKGSDVLIRCGFFLKIHWIGE